MHQENRSKGHLIIGNRNFLRT